MNRISSKWSLALAVIAPVLLFVKSEAAAAAYTFKIATMAPDRSIWINAYNAMADELSARTDGLVKFRCYAGGVQGDDTTVIRKIRIGQLQGAGLSLTGMSLVCNDSLVLQLPHVFDNYDEFNYVFSNMRPALESLCRENGYEAIGWPYLGFIYLFSQDRVQDINTLQTAKPWLIEDDIVSKTMFDIAEVSPVPAQIGDVLTGLRSGLIRTVYAPPVGMLALQWFTRVRYRVDIKGAFTFGLFLVDLTKWNRMPADLQGKVKEICTKYFDKLNNEVLEQNREATEILSKKDIETISLTDIGIRQFADVSSRVAKALAGTAYSQASLGKLQSLLAEYREKDAAGRSDK